MSDIRKVLWENVKSLMEKRWGGVNLTRLARESGFKPNTSTMLKRCDSYSQMNTVEKIATAFGVEVWTLLVDRSKKEKNGSH